MLSTDPTNLTITGIQDLDPVVEARLSGVSNVVTRLADLPFRGKITDDYGVNSAQFGFEILPSLPRIRRLRRRSRKPDTCPSAASRKGNGSLSSERTTPTSDSH